MKLRILILVLTVALVARVVFWFAVMGYEAPLRGDEADYHRLAVSMAEGKGYVTPRGEPTATRPPLYPLMLAGVYRMFGPRVAAGRGLQVLLGTAVVFFVFLLARKLFSERVALAAAALAAVNPSLIFISSYLLVENLYLVLLLSALAVFAEALERFPSKRVCAGCGILLGAASITRPNALPLALFIVGSFLILGCGRWRARFSRAAILVAAVAVVMGPWAARNAVRFGHFIPSTTHGGLTFYQGNNQLVCDIPDYRGGVAPIGALPEWDRVEALPGEVQKDREAWRLGRAFIRENPDRVPAMAANKFLRFWRLRGDAGYSGVKSGWWWDKGKSLGALASSLDVVFIYSIGAIPLFVIGLIATFRGYRRLVFLYGVILVHTVAAVVFFGSLRMRIPVEPVIGVFAAHALASLSSALKRHPKGI